MPIPHNSKCIVFAFVPGQNIGHWVAIETFRPGTKPILMDPYGYHDNDRYNIPFFQFKYIRLLIQPDTGPAVWHNVLQVILHSILQTKKTIRRFKVYNTFTPR